MITVSSTNEQNPALFNSIVKQAIRVPKNAKIGLVNCLLNIKREINIPESTFYYNIDGGSYTGSIAVPQADYTDATEFTDWLTNQLNQNLGGVTFTVSFSYTHAGFQISWVAGYSQPIYVEMQDDLQYALGFANERLSKDAQTASFFSPLTIGSSSNRNALMIDIDNLNIMGYSTVRNGYVGTLATVPLSNTNTSALNYSPSPILYVELDNDEAFEIKNLKVSIRYTDGSICPDLSSHTTLVLNIIS